MDNNLLNLDDFADLLDELNSMPEAETAPQEQPMSEEELASLRRYEEIIKKHSNHQP